ncbi:SET domain-containing protein-lysine N-methyltransferase [Prosthecochloris sp. GSB1]|uniref:SET domain-containing protein-lysine N-methyltransferase n=1 Tax=Prosthecochloris sp. GSB1 TaxID=281093 RepID=UPI000B8CF063|nr:SET domain-containing protein-lysine N-methyltransferase [Prosthecochloris sp. GSB1]ASQ90417.1 SET domain-containing protein-lysine N-methyltransferase [Prosthecochloris sp. GSB1]
MEPHIPAFFLAALAAGLSSGIQIGRKLRWSERRENEGSVRIGPSNVSGRGAFAGKEIAKGDVIERCPVLELDEKDVGGELMNYVFYGENETRRLVAMGNGMLFNHSSTPNVGYYLEDTPLGPELVLYALRCISEGEEMFYNYGDEWWSSRQAPTS